MSTERTQNKFLSELADMLRRDLEAEEREERGDDGW